MLALAVLLWPGSGAGQSPQAGTRETPEDLAKQKENPVSSLINLPLEFDWNYRAGSFERTAASLNLQPVWPAKLSQKWNLIPRFVLPVLDVPIGPDSRKTGLGDSTLSLFLSPQEPVSWGNAGVVWGVGPIVLLPTATSPLLGLRKWGVGPTAAIVATDGPWVTVALAQNTWSVDGVVNQFLFQAVINDNFEGGLAIYVGTDVNADWTQSGKDRWTAAIGPGVSQTFFLGKQAMSASLAAKPYFVRPPLASAWVLQFTISLLFPK